METINRILAKIGFRLVSQHHWDQINLAFHESEAARYKVARYLDEAVTGMGREIERLRQDKYDILKRYKWVKEEIQEIKRSA